MASAHNISIQCTNQNNVYEAMKRTFKTSIKYKHAIQVKNLYSQLKKDRIGTASVESLSKKLCNTLPRHKERTLVRTIINWKLQDSHIKLRHLERENTSTWRKEKEVIKRGGILREYKRLWRRETTRHENELNKYHTNQRFRPPTACPSLNYIHYQGIMPSVKKKRKKKVQKKS